jgi:AraC-like DNA-binding protein
MPATFGILERHLASPPALPPGGKVVLSRLGPGRSSIGARAASLKLLLEGEAVYEVDRRQLKVGPGHFLYLDAGADCVMTSGEATIGLCLVLPAEAFRQADLETHDPVLGRTMIFSTRTSDFGRALEDHATRVARAPASGSAMASVLIELTQRAIEEPLAGSRTAIQKLGAAKVSTRRDLFQRLERARGFLHAHERRQVTLAELARVSAMSQFHLARYFKAAFGVSPILYHRRLRLAQAARQIGREDCRLSEVADLTGYACDVSLSHAFKRQFGSAPKTWARGRAQPVH